MEYVSKNWTEDQVNALIDKVPNIFKYAAFDEGVLTTEVLKKEILILMREGLVKLPDILETIRSGNVLNPKKKPTKLIPSDRRLF